MKPAMKHIISYYMQYINIVDASNHKYHYFTIYIMDGHQAYNQPLPTIIDQNQMVNQPSTMIH